MACDLTLKSAFLRLAATVSSIDIVSLLILRELNYVVVVFYRRVIAYLVIVVSCATRTTRCAFHQLLWTYVH